MVDKLKKLLTIKSIVTILLTLLFCFLGVKNIIEKDEIVMIYTTVIAFYFGTQVERS